MQQIIDEMIRYAMENYKGEMQSRHLSVAIKHNNIITDFKYNHREQYVLGSMRGSTHAEMDVIQSVLKKLPRRFKEHYVL